MAEKSDSARLIERHIQTAMQLIVLAMLFWNFKTVQDMSITIARQEERIAAMVSTIQRLSMRSDNLYSPNDAEKDFARVYKIILSHEDRIEKVESRISGVESQKKMP